MAEKDNVSLCTKRAYFFVLQMRKDLAIFLRKITITDNKILQQKVEALKVVTAAQELKSHEVQLIALDALEDAATKLTHQKHKTNILNQTLIMNSTR